MSLNSIIAANQPVPRPKKTKAGAKIAADLSALSSYQFGEGEVLAFDQALTNTGFVHLQAGPDLVQYEGQPLKLAAREYYKYAASEDDPTGALLTLKKTAALARWMERVLRVHSPVRTVVYEMPVVAGHRTESILLGAYALFEACRNTNRPEPICVNNQHAKRVIVGQVRGATKHDVKGAVNAFVPDWMRVGSTQPWNEHVIDATLLGMTWLYENRGDQA